VLYESRQFFVLQKSVFRIGQDVGNMNSMAFQQDPRHDGSASRHNRQAFYSLAMFRLQPIACCPVVSSATLADNGSYVCLAKPSSGLSQGVEDCLQIERRPADGFQHVGCCRLLLEGLAQLVE
jgi:hypothetical protein